MIGRRSLVVLTTVVLAGCSLLPGGDSDDTPSTSTPPGPAPAVAWTSASADEVVDGGTLRLAVDAIPQNLNAQHTSAADTQVARLLQPTVGSAVRLTDDGGWEVDPDYATSVEITDRDPLTVRVELNPDAVWEGGTPITADDMVAYWEAQNGSDSAYEVRSTVGFDDIASVEPDGRFAYDVEFDEPTIDWPRYVYPALPKNVSNSPKLFNSGLVDKNISNGPFRIASVDRDRGQVVMERNPRWWGTEPKLESITWQAAAPKVQLEALANDELDAVDVPVSARSVIADLGDDVGLQVAAGTEWTTLTMNAGRAPLDDVEVRRAVAMAIDRGALARQAVQGLSTDPVVQGSFVLVPGQDGYLDQSTLVDEDLAAAGKLLDDAGWTKGSDGVRAKGDQTLRLELPMATGTTANRARAKAIAAQLEKLGVEVELDEVDDATYFSERIIPLDFDLATFVQSGSAFPVVDAKARFYPLDSGQNFTGTEDDDLGGAWDKGIAALDDAERARVVKVLDERLFRDVPMLPLGLLPTVDAVRDGVVNYGAAQFLQPDWTLVGFRQAEQAQD